MRKLLDGSRHEIRPSDSGVKASSCSVRSMHSAAPASNVRPPTGRAAPEHLPVLSRRHPRKPARARLRNKPGRHSRPQSALRRCRERLVDGVAGLVLLKIGRRMHSAGFSCREWPPHLDHCLRWSRAWSACGHRFKCFWCGRRTSSFCR